MRIQSSGVDFQRTGPTGGVQSSSVDAAKKQAAAPPTPVQRGDKVQISDAGRALAAQQSESAGGARSELSAERIDQIRQRILQGAYNSAEVVEEVARRMLERGDI